ncbi:MAG: type I restriction enzyme HsdR N-terminal domain-containing protein [Helicobacteraceae bacterium]|jgi:hypothetical protein|nr:type I restriction enzyme HsdR N-terminal domain-containing protein [Helicobacteraceae bacterium]
MQAFTERVRAFAAHIAKIGELCDNEETTKQAAIVPLLNILGFSSIDPTKMRAEYRADFAGAKANERVDYALFQNGKPVMFIEAKGWNEALNNHEPQLARYFNAIPEVTFSAITNGREWRFFTDLNAKNVMDSDPFLTIDFMGDLDDWAIGRLYNFRHENFQPDTLKSLAFNSTTLNSFVSIVDKLLRDPDIDFVRFVAARADFGRLLSAKFLESVAPQLKEAIGRVIGGIAMTGLTAAPPSKTSAATPESDEQEEGDIVDPDNPKIVTTKEERLLFRAVKDILGEEANIEPKDSETYYSVIYKGNMFRWLLRFYGNKKNPLYTILYPYDRRSKTRSRAHGIKTRRGRTSCDRKTKRFASRRWDCARRLRLQHNDDNFRRAKKEKAAE